MVGICSHTAPGSLECILSGILDLYRAMDDLTYQIDVSDSFDSGNGSDDEEEDTEAETSRTEDIDITVCHICSQVVCKVRPKVINHSHLPTIYGHFSLPPDRPRT